MKKLIIAMLALCASAFGGVRMEWDYPPEFDPYLAGFKVWKKNGTNWTVVASVTNKLWDVSLPGGVHTLAVTAVGKLGQESPMSDTLDVAVLVAVVNLRIVQP